MSGQEEKELLLSVVLKLAKKLLQNDGVVRPFGGALRANRVVTIVRPSRIKQNATLEEVDAYWVRELRRVANEKNCQTVCFCAEVVAPSSTGMPFAAVLVRIEQDGSVSEEFIYPYRKYVDSGVSLDTPIVKQVENRVFKAGVR